MSTPRQTTMNTSFGDVASLYDAVRPEHPAEIAGLVLGYAGRTPTVAAEIGPGTGKATMLFAGRGFPIICVEPDDRMSNRLLDRLPGADLTVVTSSFEDWTPPANGVDLLYACLAWHWLEPATRAALAVRALAPGGTLALVGRRTVTVDPELEAAISAIFAQFPGNKPQRPPLPEYAVPELEAEPDLTDIRAWTLSQPIDWTTDGYLNLQETFAPFRFRLPEIREAMSAALRVAIDERGGTIRTRLDTYVVLARRP